ncbi:MAG: prephenate dehydratase [Alphaproteobacteria bacterium]|nr:MAG: prephenate dehydratase [Alphaproteobacteria bacterium]
MPTTKKKKVAYQGCPGAYSDMACRAAAPDYEPLPCNSFADAFDALEDGHADYAMIPIDNAIAGRVADIHHLLPNRDFYIQKEYFMPIHHCLLGVKGAKLEDITRIFSHVHALPQCRKFTKPLGAEEIVYGDTARSAQKVAEDGNKDSAAIASALAGEIYGLEVLAENIEDEPYNTTRFILLSKNAKVTEFVEGGRYITSLIFEVRNWPAALYKSLGGFATAGINMTKLESYMMKGNFVATQFYCEAEAHPKEQRFQYALEEMAFFASSIRTMGTYEADPNRQDG